MPHQALKTLARLAHNPNRYFNLGTEFGLRIDVHDGKFEVRISDFEEEEVLEEASASTESPARTRIYNMSPSVHQNSLVWLTEEMESIGRMRSDASTLAVRYPKFSKEWTDALLEWEIAGQEYADPGLCPSKGPYKPYQFNAWVFQGMMLACWLAIQDDVLYVQHWLTADMDRRTVTHDKAGEELQRFLKGFPWDKEKAEDR